MTDELVIIKEKCDYNEQCPNMADTKTRVYNISSYKRYALLHDEATQFHEFKTILEKFYITHMIPSCIRGKMPPLQLLNVRSWDDFAIHICNFIMHRDKNMKSWKFGWVGWVLDFVKPVPEYISSLPMDEAAPYFSYTNITCVWYRHPDNLENYSSYNSGMYKSHMLPWRYLCTMHQSEVHSSQRHNTKAKVTNYVLWSMLEYLLHIQIADHMKSTNMLMPFVCDGNDDTTSEYDIWWDKIWKRYDPALYDIEWIVIPKYQVRNFRKCKKKFENVYDIHARIMHLSNWIVIDMKDAQLRAVLYKDKKISYERALRMPHSLRFENSISLLKSKEYVITKDGEQTSDGNS